MKERRIAGDTPTGRIIRHRLVDRVFHWAMALLVLFLLGTAFLPIWGLKFAWLELHWISGLILIVVVVAHALWAILRQDFRSMRMGPRDARDLWNSGRALIGLGEAPRAAKYSVFQKLQHNAVTLIVLVSIATGLLMLTKIDTPWWRRDPYWLTDATWGIIYVFHGLAAILMFGLLITHIYFGLRPEKFFYTRSMVLGWITRGEFEKNHDPERWRAAQAATDPPPKNVRSSKENT